MGECALEGVEATVERLRSDPTPHGEAEREALLERNGWRAVHGEPVALHHRGRRYLCTPLASSRQETVHLVEWLDQSGVPEYPVRSDLQRRVPAAQERSIVLFKDAAGTREVWGSRARLPFGPDVYLEDHGRAELPHDPDEEWPAPPAPALVEVDPEMASRGARAARDLLIRRLGRTPRISQLLRGMRGAAAADQIQRCIERSRDPEVVRRIWREIENLRVLDPVCGTGDWLLGCLEALAAAALACLDRMQGWVEDRSFGGRPPRRDLYADFHRQLRHREELARNAFPGRLAWEMVLLRCLHGAEADSAAASRARRRLAGRLDRAEPRTLPRAATALADVRVGSLCGGLRTRTDLAELWHRHPTLGRVASRLEQETEAYSRAEAQLIDIRLAAGGSVDDLAEGRCEIRYRREALTELLPRTTADGPAKAVLHPWIEYSGVIDAGGFHLVRHTGQSCESGGNEAWS